MELSEALSSLHVMDDDDDQATAMPFEVLICVLAVSLAGDIVSLCTVACVCRAWRHAASEPSLWRRLQALPARHAPSLYSNDIELLAARSNNTLESIDLAGTFIFADEARAILSVACGHDVTVLADADDGVKGRCEAHQIAEFYSNRDDSDVDDLSDDERWRSSCD